MNRISIIDRKSGLVEEEKVFGERALRLLWENKIIFFLFGWIAKVPLISAFYGWLKKQPSSKKEVAPFIETYGVDANDFEKKVSEFTSFNDFFIRTLKPEKRPLAETSAICPADGRYTFLQGVDPTSTFTLKGQELTLASFIQDEKVAASFSKIDLMLIRLCPTDYHRFHFPCDGIARESRLIKGSLYSVNPIALAKRKTIFLENRRRWTLLESKCFGPVVLGEIGATFVGSIHETYRVGPVKKGDEKGYFEFGGSAILLAFSSQSFTLSQDLLLLKKEKGANLEIKCHFGEPLGTATLSS